jgi:hypothetical protein
MGVLGSDQRLFGGDGQAVKLRLLGNPGTTTGAILAPYQPI